MSYRDQAQGIYVVTPDDSNLLARQAAGIYLAASGDVKITSPQGDVVVVKGLATGIVHPIRAIKIWATGTTVTSGNLYAVTSRL